MIRERLVETTLLVLSLPSESSGALHVHAIPAAILASEGDTIISSISSFSFPSEDSDVPLISTKIVSDVPADATTTGARKGSDSNDTFVRALCMMMSAAFSAIITVGAPVCPPGIFGITEESAMRIPKNK